MGIDLVSPILVQVMLLLLVSGRWQKSKYPIHHGHDCVVHMAIAKVTVQGSLSKLSLIDFRN